jgi:7,8-dihydropterin-6-yl-methyl-4-(beta-D-ribofuranosyl)aminobenzene 5'-phosphate synthase
MKITVVYDNETGSVNLRKGHGFSALIEDEGMPPLLFDTGADGPTLLHNMKELNIDPRDIETVVISHAHDDHVGGLSEILRTNKVAELYLPSSFKRAFPVREVTEVKDPVQIRKNVFSTGELEGVEQSLPAYRLCALRDGKDSRGRCQIWGAIQEIRDLFGDRALECGVGSIIEL